jgi:hypothetical protein
MCGINSWAPTERVLMFRWRILPWVASLVFEVSWCRGLYTQGTFSFRKLLSKLGLLSVIRKRRVQYQVASIAAKTVLPIYSLRQQCKYARNLDIPAAGTS